MASIFGYEIPYSDEIVSGLDLFSGLFGQSSKDDSMSDIVNLLAKQRQQQFEEGKTNYDAYTQHLMQANAISNANRAAAAAHAAAMANAKRKEFQNQKRALQTGLGAYTDRINQALQIFNPFISAGQKVLPQRTAAFERGLGELNAVADQLFTPQTYGSIQNKPSLLNMRLNL